MSAKGCLFRLELYKSEHGIILYVTITVTENLATDHQIMKDEVWYLQLPVQLKLLRMSYHQYHHHLITQTGT